MIEVKAIRSALNSGKKEVVKQPRRKQKEEMKRVVKQAAKIGCSAAVWAKPNQAKSAGLCYEVWP